MCCLGDAIPHSKEFGFYRSNVYDMVDGVELVRVNISNIFCSWNGICDNDNSLDA